MERIRKKLQLLKLDVSECSSDLIMERVLLLLFVFALPSWNVRLISVADAQIISVLSSSETEVTLYLYKDYRNCNYTLYCFNGGWQQISQPYQDFVTTYRVQFLSPGRRYYFYLVAICEGNYTDTGFVTAVTTPLNVDRVIVTQLNDGYVTLMWYKFKDFRYSYILKYGIFEISIWDIYNQSSIVIDSYLFPGRTYNFTLYTVYDGVRSRGYDFSVTFPLRGPYCKDSWWDSTPSPVGNVPQYGVQENGGRPQYMNETRFQTISVDFRTDTVSVMCRTKGVIAALTVATVGLTLIIMLIFVFLGVNRKIKTPDHRSSSRDHIYVNTSSLS